jgi:transcriptional regulator with XRE-family HTH domain
MEYNFPNGINPQDVFARINSIRTEHNLNQEQLARQLSISQSAVSKYLKQRIPPADILLKLAQIGNTTMEWILTGEKKTFFTTDTITVNEESTGYSSDIDIRLAQKIARLPLKARQVILQLINILQ